MKIYKPNDVSEYEDILDKHDLILVQFSASWCGPCRKITPEIQEYLGKLENDDNAYIYCDIDKSYASELATELKIQSIPTFVIYSLEYLETITTCDLDNVIKYLKMMNFIDLE